MSVALQVVNALLFSGIALVAGIQWKKDRDPSSFWFFATFLTIALVAITGGLAPLGHHLFNQVWVTRVTTIIFVAFPYCLYRFAEIFAAWSRRVRYVVLTVVGIFGLWTVFLPAHEIAIHSPTASTTFLLYTIYLLVTWLGVSMLVAVRLWRLGRGQPGVVQHRLRTMALGIGGLALAILVAGGNSQAESVRAFIQLVASFTALSFYIGFRPTQAVKAAWSRREQAESRRATQAVLVADSAEQAIEGLLPSVTRILGGTGARLRTRDRDFTFGDAPEITTFSGNEPAIMRSDSQTIAFVPLKAGVLAVATPRYAAFFTADELDLAKTVGAVIDLAFERERRQREQLRRRQAEADAQLLQRSLLPGDLPHIDNLQLAACYLPAQLQEKVGGDWYDAFLIADDLIALVVGDVVGKGLEAASFMGRIRNAVWAYFCERGDPATAVALVQHLTERRDAHNLTTLCCAALNLTTLELSWVSAGHLPIILIREGQAKVLLYESDPPLGAGVIQTTKHTQQLQSKDRLLFYTDGLVERRGKMLDEGLEYLGNAASESTAKTADGLIDDIVRALLPEGSGEDDAVIMVVQIS